MSTPRAASKPPELTRGNAPGGHDRPLNTILPKVYDELRTLARRALLCEAPGHTLTPTALAHEVFLRLASQRVEAVVDQRYSPSLVAVVIRRVLTDHARRKRRVKRGRGWSRSDLDGVSIAANDSAPSERVDLIALNDALARLEILHARQAKVVELRYYLGLSIEATAKELGIAVATANRDWELARIWLKREIAGETPRDG